MNRKEEIDQIVKRILECGDKDSITEIYVTENSMLNGKFRDSVYLMVCYDIGFDGTALFTLFADIEEEKHSCELLLSAEPDTTERGEGIVLWRREA